jgi:hypothetical protein
MIAFYHILHLVSVFVLIGCCFYATAGAPESKRTTLMVSGIAALIALVTGFGLLAREHLPFQGWTAVMIVCWLGAAAISGLAYRRRSQACLWLTLTVVFAAVATWMAYLKPF